jgi:hypothetical protein
MSFLRQYRRRNYLILDPLLYQMRLLKSEVGGLLRRKIWAVTAEVGERHGGPSQRHMMHFLGIAHHTLAPLPSEAGTPHTILGTLT